MSLKKHFDECTRIASELRNTDAGSVVLPSTNSSNAQKPSSESILQEIYTLSEPTTKECIVLLKASKLGELVFPPWNEAHITTHLKSDDIFTFVLDLPAVADCSEIISNLQFYSKKLYWDVLNGSDSLELCRTL